MIPPRNHWYRAALAGPHEALTRVEVWRSGVQVEELRWRDVNAAPYAQNTPAYFGGSVRATLGSQVTRALTLSVPDYLYPWEPTDLLNPYGTELHAFRGIRYGDGTVDEFPIFTGPIKRAKPPRGGELAIEAQDVTVRVAGAGFVAPTPSQAGDLVVDEFERLVLDAYPTATFGTHDALTEAVPALAYDTDRGAALDSLAKTADAFWYALAGGQFVLRKVPWVRTATSAPITLNDEPGGTLESAYPHRTSDGIYNQVTVASDRADGGPALWATAQDTDPTSPTYVGGPFGVRSTLIRVTGATNQGQLQVLAESLIARARTLTESWAITCVPDGSIELGDQLNVRFRGRATVQLVAGYVMPLEPAGRMIIDGRGLGVSTVEGS